MTEKDFYKERSVNIANIIQDKEIATKSIEWMNLIAKHRYAYNFDWLGRPAIQFPNDAWALQEIVWKTKPDVIVETGIAHGGSLILSASLLALLDLCDFLGGSSECFAVSRRVVGIDIDIRQSNRVQIENHPLCVYLELIEGSSVDESTFEKVKAICNQYEKVMVLLDSNHASNHVLRELVLYSELVSTGMYLIVYDTALELQDDSLSAGKPWGPGNGPLAAVDKFLQFSEGRFVKDLEISGKLGITVAPFGFLQKR